MAIIAFPQEERSLDEMSRQELLEELDKLQQRLDALDSREPKNNNGDAYALWADEHEAIEDCMDDIRDFLDALGG